MRAINPFLCEHLEHLAHSAQLFYGRVEVLSTPTAIATIRPHHILQAYHIFHISN